MDSPVNFRSEPPPSPPEQVIKVIEVDPEVNIRIDNEDEGESSSPEKQKLLVEFITIEEYTDVQGHVFQISQGEDARIVEIPYQEE